jgi:hypothetical protein
MENYGMPQFTQIRERFLANARQYLLETDTTACNCQFQCCQNSPDSSTNERTARSGKKAD